MRAGAEWCAIATLSSESTHGRRCCRSIFIISICYLRIIIFQAGCAQRSFRCIVVSALQPRAAGRVTDKSKATLFLEGEMLAYLAAEGRILGLDGGDWMLLLGGSALLGLVTLFV